MSSNRAVVTNDTFYTSYHLLEWIEDKIWQQVNTEFIKGMEVLDFSAGNGAWSQLLIKRGWNITNIDIEPTNEIVSKADFLSYQIEHNKYHLIGLNPPFGKQGTQVKNFIWRALDYQPTWLTLILPLRLRGSFKISEYKLLLQEELPDHNTFFDPFTGKYIKISIPIRFIILKRIVEESTELGTIINRKNIIIPKDWILYPRTANFDPLIHNFMVRVQGCNAGKDIIIKFNDKWKVKKGKEWCDKLIDDSKEAGWKLTVRKCGADFALLSIPLTNKDLVEWCNYLSNHPDPNGINKAPPSLSRTWLSQCARDYVNLNKIISHN